jgi:uncharacterized protein YciI
MFWDEAAAPEGPARAQRPRTVTTVYAIAIIRYRRPLEEIIAAQDEHRAYLRSLQAEGTLLASGPMEPRSGGMLLLRVPDADPAAALDRVRDGDPFTRLGLAQYELVPWKPVIGLEALDRL